MQKTGESSIEPAHAVNGGEYVVVARRYRPRRFDELIGQQHVARALSGAIASGRIGHAYLFTGARGVGKTSTARILAKALNCQRGTSAAPCNECDICQQIAAGGDVDVLEIDGASNRGIDEIRQLRQNVGVRPSRSRFKIYIIDEVHMLTREAFNALLKTLEEPPEHVKFIFCTTEPNKIPITILSRCQRFDFAGIETGSIAERLGQIVAAEGIQADPEALALVARRAAGSMRDSQSLLEQLISIGGDHITVAEVHRLLGTADDARIGALVTCLANGDAPGALAQLDGALAQGVDLGQLLEQLLGCYRDLMVVAAGAGPEAMLYLSPGERDTFAELAQRLGLSTIVACMQVVEQTLARLRYSTHGRVLAELTIVRICQLGDLDSLVSLVGQVRAGAVSLPARPAGSPAGSAVPASRAANGTASEPDPKKKISQQVASPATNGDGAATGHSDQAAAAMPSPGSALPLTESEAETFWRAAVAGVSGLLTDYASMASKFAVRADGSLVVFFEQKYNFAKEFCARPAESEQLEAALFATSGRPVKLVFEALAAPPIRGDSPGAARRTGSVRQRVAERAQHPLARRATELFDARPTGLDEPAGE